jgi:hypothetical protein
MAIDLPRRDPIRLPPGSLRDRPRRPAGEPVRLVAPSKEMPGTATDVWERQVLETTDRGGKLEQYASSARIAERIIRWLAIVVFGAVVWLLIAWAIVAGHL